MERYALVVSGCRHRGPARGAFDRSQPSTRLPDGDQLDTRVPDPRQPQPHIAGSLPVGELSPGQPCPRPHADSHARADDVRHARRAFGCSVVTTGDMV